MTRYRYDIGLNRYPYGTELEFVNASLQGLDKDFQKTALPIELAMFHKKSDTIYDRNYLDIDSTVSIQEKDMIYGGEISSRLYHNKKQDWQEIEEICQVLRENGAGINRHCSNQINVNLSPVKKVNVFMETFAKLIAECEDEIKFFYKGDCFLERADEEIYARSMRADLIRKVNAIDFSEDNDYIYDLLYRGSAPFGGRCGISLQDYRLNGRMEIRYPNGTINKKIIQNNINFSLKLVNAIEEEKIDVERLTFEIAEDLQMRRYWYDFRSEEEHYKRFEQLATTIATSTLDQDDFMSQYEKVLSTKSKGK